MGNRIFSTAIAALILASCDGSGADEASVPIEPVNNSPAPEVAASCGAPIDTNSSGVVERAEYLSFSGFAFDDWDENGDGELTPAEFHTCWRAMAWGDADRAFAIFDEDGDQRIGPEEFFEREHFSRWDTDQDEAITREEGLRGPIDRAAPQP